MSVIRPVILSGGSGTRLWPISHPSLPKQFLPIIGEESLFELTMGRTARLADAAPIVVTGAAHQETVRSQLTGEARVIVEPAPRNTAPAILAAALHAEPDEVLVVFPSDHLITDEPALFESISAAASLAETGAIVTFGVVPTRAEQGYGWIERGPERPPGFEVARFVEKPPSEIAEAFLAGGNHYWNSGIFIVKAKVAQEQIARFAPEVFSAVDRAMSDRHNDAIELADAFLASPSISFDNAVMEKVDQAFVVPLDAGWSDIGSWDAIWSALEKDSAGNVLIGEALVVDATNSLVRSSNLPVALIGLDGVIVIETKKGVLVADRSSVQQVREVVEKIRDGLEDND